MFEYICKYVYIDNMSVSACAHLYLYVFYVYIHTELKIWIKSNLQFFVIKSQKVIYNFLLPKTCKLLFEKLDKNCEKCFKLNCNFWVNTQKLRTTFLIDWQWLQIVLIVAPYSINNRSKKYIKINIFYKYDYITSIDIK